MKNRKLVLHIGYSKCGSTTIQETLTGNYGQLLERNVLFPKVLSDSPSWLRFFWEPNLPVTYSEERVRAKFIHFVDRLKKEVSDSDAQTIILSDEGLISLPSSGVSALKEFLAKFFDGYEVEVVCLVREPVSFFTSRCQQFISDRCFDDDSIRQFIEGATIEKGEVRSDCYAMNPEFFFSKNIRKYQDCFGDVKVLSFEAAIKDDVGLASFFLKSIGLDNNFSDIKLNESRSDKAIAIISYINSVMPFDARSGRWMHRRYGDLGVFCKFKGEKYTLPSDLEVTVREKTKSEVEWLNDNFGIDYRLKEIKKSSSRFDWEEGFFDEVVDMFPGLPFHLKVFFKSFLLVKASDSGYSGDSGVLLTISWIKKEYPLVYACNDRLALDFLRAKSGLRGLLNDFKGFVRPFYYRLHTRQSFRS
ncbi:hypothetical protein [Marinobacter sp.]|uniref:hypothetical protein n=1 Tax=Marinobacter sp. TaxID=50741 RepID=UPI002B279293|nr:hypothetical protein [Marinobacter sp.]